MKVRVTIERGERPISFIGEVLKQTDSHYFVQHGVNQDGGEWFAIESRFVTCWLTGKQAK
jgi:hypothetical protein